MKPHRCYLPSLSALLESPSLHALSHITGGGIVENTMRVIPKTLKLNVDWSGWEHPEVFRVIQQSGGTPEEEMRKTFNLGVGLIAIVEHGHGAEFTRQLIERGETAFVMGKVAE
jgi:phosphoribosylformylglycinamidine cyclo-ligase